LSGWPGGESAETSFIRHIVDRLIAAVFTGGDRDGTDRVQTVKARGGVVIAEDEAIPTDFGMPGSAIVVRRVDNVVPLEGTHRCSSGQSGSA
jgi:chemotaxis response regulator CheB